MTQWLAIFLLFGVVFQYEVSTWATLGEFTKFIFAYDKKYESLQEAAKRYHIFVENYKTILEYNEKQSDVILGVNQFADLTREEFKQKYLKYVPRTTAKSIVTNAEEKPKSNQAPNPIVDWRKLGKVSRVKNQYSCGSCWAFSAIGALESLHAIKKGSVIEYSEQELVDCSLKYGNEGCDGGEMGFAFDYIKDKGISLESEYPYEARDGRCKKKSNSYQISGYKNVTADDNDELLAVLNTQPVSIAVDAESPVFMFYKGGIITHDCGTELDHGILLVGADINTEKNVPYWIVKNSWGRNWGIEGYAYIKRDTGKSHGVCGIAMDDSYPIA